MGLAQSLPWIPKIPIGRARAAAGAGARAVARRSRGGGGEVVAGPWSATSRDRPVARRRRSPSRRRRRPADARPGRARRPARQDLGQRHGRPHRRREAPPQRAVQAPAQPQVAGRDRVDVRTMRTMSTRIDDVGDPVRPRAGRGGSGRCGCSSTVATCSGVPSATTVPPPLPPSGPRSMIQSAVLMTSRLCSMTSTVLPWSTSRDSTVEQPADVLEVQAGGGLVEEVDRVAGGALGQLGGQLHPLRLAARQRRRRLAEAHVAEADVDQRLHVAGDRRLVGEELERLLARQVEHLGDVLALERDVERVAVVAGALAHLARHVDVGQEVHLDLDRAVAGARLAAAALDVEAEPPGQVAADLGLAASRRTACGCGRTRRCRWPGSTAACARSATGRCR